MTEPGTFSELGINASLLLSAATDAERLADAEITDIAQALEIRKILTEAAKAFSSARQLLDTAIGEQIPEPVVIEKFGRVRRHAKMSRRKWDSEMLIRDVLDSVAVNKDTGEIVPESPVEKIRSVWSLAGYDARIAGIHERGLQVDEYCEQEFRGYTLEIK